MQLILFDNKDGVRLIEKSVAKDLIIKHHYSHAWTSCKYAFGLIIKNKIVGVIVYGFPVGRQVVKSISPLLENNNVLELTRMWVEDSQLRNAGSSFIAQTFRWLRKNDEDTWILISYADPMASHVGFIYQATNWLYQGSNIKLFKSYMHYVNGKWLHPRTCVAKYGTASPKKLKVIDENSRRKLMPRKHRYLYVLNKRMKDRILKSLKHPILPYVKNSDNCEWK